MKKNLHSTIAGYSNFLNDAPEPLFSLRNFTATYSKQGVSVTWISKGSNDNAVYILERSEDGDWFDVIDIKAVKTDLENEFVYAFTDDEVIQNSLYRLRIITNSSIHVIPAIKPEGQESYSWLDCSA